MTIKLDLDDRLEIRADTLRYMGRPRDAEIIEEALSEILFLRQQVLALQTIRKMAIREMGRDPQWTKIK